MVERSRPVHTALLLTILLPATAIGRDRHPGFSRFPLELPGIPAAMIPADVDRDGVEDLVVVVAYTDWGDVATFEETHFDGVEGMVEVMSVVTSLIDHRELRVYPGLSDGTGYGAPLPALELDISVHALAAGHPALPLVAITDDGISAVRYVDDPAGAPLALKPLVEQENLYTDSASFYSELEFLVDLDDDAIPDLLLPTGSGWTAFAGTETGFDPRSHSIRPPPVADPEEEDASQRPQRRRLPTVRDLTGDGLPELFLVSPYGESGVVVYRNLGGLRFSESVEYGAPRRDSGGDTDADESPHEEYVYLGALKRDGPAWAVTRTEIERWDDPTVSQEIDQAKRPLFGYALQAIGPDLSLGGRASAFEAIGYTFEGADSDDDEGNDKDEDGEEDDIEVRLPGGFQDLDGDGRDDLVSISLDFSILPLITRILVTQSIKLTMDFHAWCQQPDGTFREIRNLDLSGKFKFNFRKNTLRHLSQFAGDFNADGRADFVQLGRGKRVTIHHGRPGCEYPTEPSSTIVLERKPEHLGLVRILDLNADARSDLYVVHPLGRPKKGRHTPVRVDLYLSAD